MSPFRERQGKLQPELYECSTDNVSTDTRSEADRSQESSVRRLIRPTDEFPHLRGQAASKLVFLVHDFMSTGVE